MDDNQGSDAPRLDIAIALITSGDVRVEYMESTINSLIEKVASNWFVTPCGPYLDIGRNKGVYTFLDGMEHEWLLYVDSDIQFNIENVRQVYEYAVEYEREHGVYPVVGGSYLGIKDGGAAVIAYRRLDPDDASSEFENIEMTEVLDHKDTTDVDGMGTGFMLIHRSILENMRKGYHSVAPLDVFACVAVDHHWAGEDITFCLRAAHMGYPVKLHRGVRLIHYKTIGLKFPEQEAAT